MRDSNPYRGPSVWPWWTWWPYYIRCALWARWNAIKIPTLGPTYHEPDELILHASMTLLVRFVERQAEQIDWTATDDHANARAEMGLIYHWWTIGRIAMKEEALQHLDYSDGEFMRLSHEADATDQAMLVRLIAIREYLWT